MPERARVTYPDGKVMTTTGNIRIPQIGTVNTVAGWTEFPPDQWETEIIPEPEPRWIAGDVVADSVGNKFVQLPSGRWREVLGLDIQPVRPLVRLVPAA